MASIGDLIADKVRRLTEVPDEFLSQVEKAQKELFPEVVELLMQLHHLILLLNKCISFTKKN